MKEALPGTPELASELGEAAVYLFPILCYFVGFCPESLVGGRKARSEWRESEGEED